MLPHSLFICRRKFFMISWMFFLFVISQIFSSLISSGEVLPSVYVELSWQFVGEMMPASVATIGIKSRSINFAYASLLFKLIKSVCLICLCSAGYHGIYQQIIQNYYAKTAPFSNGHSFLPIDNAIFAIKKNISCLNTPNGPFQKIK